MSDSLRPPRLYSPWNSPGQNTRVDSLSLLQGIFPSQGLNQVSRIAGGFFTSWATREAHETHSCLVYFLNHQKVRTSSYKISIRDVSYNVMTIISLDVWYIWKVVFRFFFFSDLFIVILAVEGLHCYEGFSLVGSGVSSLLRHVGFSLRGLPLLWSMGSRHTVFRSRSCGLSGCGTQASLLCGMWDLPRPGIKLLSLALQGRCFLNKKPLFESF